MANDPAGAAPATRPVPPTVRWAVWCWVAATVVYVVGTLAAVVVTFARVDDYLPRDAGDRATATVNSVFVGFLIAGTVVVLAAAAMVVLFAGKLRSGTEWARITLTVLGVVFVLFNVPSAFGGGSLRLNGRDIDVGVVSVVGTVSAAVTLVLLIAALVLQWLPAGRAHFVRAPQFAPPWPPPPAWQPGTPGQPGPPWPTWPPPPGQPGPPAAAWPQAQPGPPGTPWPPPQPGPPGPVQPPPQSGPPAPPGTPGQPERP